VNLLHPLFNLLIGLAFLAVLMFLFWPNGGVIGYFRRMREMSQRVLQEDALKHIHKSERHGQVATLDSLAGALQISANQAVELVTDMQHKELVNLDGDELHLTPDGRRYALQIIRAHRLWERYLAHETGYKEQEWHDLADRLEHKLAPEEADLLDAELGYPTYDPHGDPIPTADGEMKLHGGEPLTNMPLDQPLTIVHLEDEPEVVYAQLLAEGLYPGMKLRLLEHTPQRVRFWANGDEHILAPIVAANISVVPLVEETNIEPEVGVPLSVLSPGEEGEILELSPRLRAQERRRLMDFGILPKTRIVAEMAAPEGQPIAYRVRGSLIALRREQTDLIRIKRIQEEN